MVSFEMQFPIQHADGESIPPKPLSRCATLRVTSLIVLEEGRRSRLIMSTLFALIATVLTSFLPICNKYLLRDARPTMVAWIVNAASLPLLALGTLALTQCPLSVSLGHL